MLINVLTWLLLIISAGLAALALSSWRKLQQARSGMQQMEDRLAVLESQLNSQRQEYSAYLKRSRHDILGALNIVSGFLELLQAGGAGMMDDTNRSYMGHMTAGVHRSITIADGLATNFTEKQSLKEEAR